MFNFVRTAGLAAVAALSMTAAADAAIVYATGVTDVVSGTRTGTSATDLATQNTAASLGASDNAWYSLGLGGTATYTFAPSAFFKAPGTVIEITKGVRENHIETLDVFGVLAGVETLIAQVTNSGTQSLKQSYTFGFAGIFDSLKLVDTSSNGSGARNGFDVESISVASVPLPAGGLLLLTGLAGIAALRRRKAAV